jgi:L-ribulose-5-phosphate 4-epimerase
MMLKALKQQVCEANCQLVSAGLVTLTWGNVSGIDRAEGLVAIKPSGVPYAELKPKHIVVVDLEGRLVEGDLKPSSDTPTHVALYRAFANIGGVVHTHSRHATIFAQARREIPCLGTTHADHFHGPVPVARPLNEQEVAEDYEGHTGTVIIQRFAELNPDTMPAVLVAGHAPFAWGSTVEKAVENAVALEAVAAMAIGTWSLDPAAPVLESWVLEKHYERKHGPTAYYGQHGPVSGRDDSD